MLKYKPSGYSAVFKYRHIKMKQQNYVLYQNWNAIINCICRVAEYSGIICNILSDVKLHLFPILLFVNSVL